ncbi:MFS transporter [Pseudonocardia acaciae]|uniref:MFS transporter n=1 Tax=Pseudonocardia acaciae TaxID=551276 RepID=UPI00055D2DBA|nr:MFS transporter [Pseudonocardia acaciae]
MSTAAELGARLDRLPVGRFHRRVLYALAFGFFFELADLNTFAYAAPGLREYQHLSVADIGYVTSASFLGMFLGATGAGWLADRLGRRRALIVSVLWYSLFSLLNAGAWETTTLLAARLLTGAGLSAMTVVAITYLSETMPRAHRGRMQGAVLATGLVGIPVMAFVARAVVPTGPNGWRWVFLFGALGVFAVALIVRLPESPRWLLGAGQAERADAVVTDIERDAEREHGTLPPVQVVADASAPARIAVRRMFTPPLRRRTGMLLVAWIFQTLGFYGFVSWVPTLLAEHGFSVATSLTFSALTTIGAVPGALAAWPVSDRFRRKAPAAVVAVLVAACGIAYGLSFNAVAIVAFGFAVSFLIQTFAALLYAYTPELYPTAVRNTGSGFAYGVGRLANILGPLAVAAIFSGAGYAWVFVYIGACWLVVAAAIALFGPRSGQVGLEEFEL